MKGAKWPLTFFPSSQSHMYYEERDHLLQIVNTLRGTELRDILKALEVPHGGLDQLKRQKVVAYLYPPAAGEDVVHERVMALNVSLKL